MKRVVYAVPGVLAIVGSVVCGPAAHAALGSLVVNGTVYHDPTGCLQFGGGASPLVIENHTAATITVYYQAGCKGETGTVLVSGDSRTFSGSSIQVP
jgi:hypothetical protein